MECTASDLDSPQDWPEQRSEGASHHPAASLGTSGGLTMPMMGDPGQEALTWEMAPSCLSSTPGCLAEEIRGGGLEMGGRGRTGRTLSWRPRGSG